MNHQILSREFVDKYKNKTPNWGFGIVGYVVYKRTYARIKENGQSEEWFETIERCINGAQKIGANYSKEEAERLFDHIFNFRCSFSGRGLWQLGTKLVNDAKIFDSLLNCWVTKVSCVDDFVFIFSESMFGGGVGCNISKEYTQEIPRVKVDVSVKRKDTKDADFIIPDSKEGWAELWRKILSAYLITGKSFTYSPVCIRSSGEPIKTFGGIAPGPKPLMDGALELCRILENRAGKKLRTQDVADIVCLGGQVVKSGGVRRTAIILLGDVDDAAYLNLKRWDLGNIPNYRSNSNNSLICNNFDHLPEKFWDGYNGNGEPYGLVNIKNARRYGRIGESEILGFTLKDDNIIGFNPCFRYDTKILTENGWRKIGDLVGKKVNIYQDNRVSGYLDAGIEKWDINLEKENVSILNEASNIRKTAQNQKIYKLQLSCGREVFATSNHAFATTLGMKNISSLNIGDEILIPLCNSPKINKDSDDFNIGYLCGLIQGDGSFVNDNVKVQFWGDENIKEIERVQDIIHSIIKSNSEKLRYRTNCNKLPVFRKSTGFVYGSKSTYRLHSSLLKQIINSEGFLSKDSCEWIHYKNKDFKAGFISGYIFSDGHSEYNTNSKSLSVRISSVNLPVLRDVQLVLQELGVFSRINTMRESGSRILPDENRNPKSYPTQKCFRLIISGHTNVNRLPELLILPEKDFNTIKNVNKISKRTYKQREYSKVKDISFYGIEDVFCLTENNKRTLIADGMSARRCGEATLHDKEQCNLSELFINNLSSKEEMLDCAKLLYKTQKAISLGNYFHEETNNVSHKNCRIGMGITGICQKLDIISEWSDYVYNGLREFDIEYSKKNNFPQSIRITVIKPSGTLSLLGGSTPGGHPGFSKYFIRRIRFSSNDPLLAILRNSNYHTEPEIGFDGKENHDTYVVEFPCYFSDSTIISKNFSAIDQLNLLKLLQEKWADQAVSITVYYKPEELVDVKKWLKDNYNTSIKSVSFLLHSDHGFKQAPLEEIDELKYQKMLSKVKPLEFNKNLAFDGEIDSQECAGGHCPLK